MGLTPTGRLVAGGWDPLRHLPHPAATKQDRRGNGHASLIDKPSFGGVLHTLLQLKDGPGISPKSGETIPTLLCNDQYKKSTLT